MSAAASRRKRAQLLRILVERSHGRRDSPAMPSPPRKDCRRQPSLGDRGRYRTDDVKRVGVDPVQDAARKRYVIVIAAGERRRRQGAA